MFWSHTLDILHDVNSAFDMSDSVNLQTKVGVALTDSKYYLSKNELGVCRSFQVSAL